MTRDCATLALALFALASGCGDKAGGGDLGPPGGPASGPMDTHCSFDGGVRKQVVDPAVCKFMPDGGMIPEDHAETLYGSEGNDIDCKYRLMWSAATPIYQNRDVTLMVMLTTLADGKPATGASPYVEVFLSDTHPAPGTNQKATEESPGHYMIGPVRFDAAGKWTMELHIRGDCYEYAEESPHGHAAFFVNVP